MFVIDIRAWEEYGQTSGEFFSEIMLASAMVELSRLINSNLLTEIEAEADL